MQPGPADYWLKRYVHADNAPRHDGKQGDEIATEFLKEHPGVDEICYSTYHPASIMPWSGVVVRSSSLNTTSNPHLQSSILLLQNGHAVLLVLK